MKLPPKDVALKTWKKMFIIFLIAFIITLFFQIFGNNSDKTLAEYVLSVIFTLILWFAIYWIIKRYYNN